MDLICYYFCSSMREELEQSVLSQGFNSLRRSSQIFASASSSSNSEKPSSEENFGLQMSCTSESNDIFRMIFYLRVIAQFSIETLPSNSSSSSSSSYSYSVSLAVYTFSSFLFASSPFSLILLLAMDLLLNLEYIALLQNKSC